MELIQTSLGMVPPLNHRPSCLGQIAFGHRWLGSQSPMFPFDLVCPSVYGTQPTPQPSCLGESNRGFAFKSISYFKYHLFWGDAGPQRGNGHIVAICCLMVADILFAYKQMPNCQRAPRQTDQMLLATSEPVCISASTSGTHIETHGIGKQCCRKPPF